jgi:hypothetical protein
MPDDRLSEAAIEQMLEACATLLDAQPAAFTPWERTFLAGVIDRNCTLHLTPQQREKLLQICRERGVEEGHDY